MRRLGWKERDTHPPLTLKSSMKKLALLEVLTHLIVAWEKSNLSMSLALRRVCLKYMLNVLGSNFSYRAPDLLCRVDA
jgi:hypothetical protein